MFDWLAIVVVSVLACVTYGVIHDQVTARICIEYFTLGHPQAVRSTDPTVIGLVWGVIATWWVGVLLGLPLATAARIGSRPPRSVRSLFAPMALSFLGTALFASAAGALAYLLASGGSLRLIGTLADVVPPEKQTAFLVDLWTHNASYLGGVVGSIVVISSVWRSRGLAVAAVIPDDT